MAILVTGGCGYIGSHTAVELLNNGHEIVIADNLSNSKAGVIDRIEGITGKRPPFYQIDISNTSDLSDLFQKHTIDAAIHFAAHKAVGESISLPLHYYRNNLNTTLSLCEVMDNFGVKNLIFSSSATVYGDAQKSPIKESSKIGTGITNPYGQSKFMIEQILQDLAVSDNKWRIVILRYFNPIGAHPSGLIGEDPNGKPNNLLPYISQVATGELDNLKVFGGDYPTPDGTCIRDYIHVTDLAKGHIAAMRVFKKESPTRIYNLGTGNGTSVLEAITAFENASGVKINYEVAGRRGGDISECYADVNLAKSELDWQAEYNLDQACGDLWRWQTNNSNGLKESA